MRVSKNSIAKSALIISALKVIYEGFKKYGFVTYIFEEDSPTFKFFKDWVLANKAIFPLENKFEIPNVHSEMTVKSDYTGYARGSTVSTQEKIDVNHDFKFLGGKGKPELNLSSVSGIYKCHDFYFLLLSDAYEKKVNSGAFTYKKFTVKVLRSDSHKFSKFIKEIYSFPFKAPMPVVKVTEYHHTARVLGDISVPDFDPILLPEEALEIYNDLEEFLKSEDWYTSRKYKYKRSYLLYGVPGTGKSTLIQQIVKAMGMDILYVPINQILNADQVLNIISGASVGNIAILIEDLHNLKALAENSPRFINKKEASLLNDDDPYKDLAAIQNLLDGSLSYHGQIVFLTTNSPDTLPEPLLRKGRIDMDIEIKPLTPEKVNINYNNFFGLPLNTPSFQKRTHITMADLSAILIKNKKEPGRALELLNDFTPKVI